MWYDSVAEGGELGGAAQAGGGGDPAVGEALHPFDEGGVEAAVDIDGFGCGAGEGFPTGDGGGVESPLVGHSGRDVEADGLWPEGVRRLGGVELLAVGRSEAAADGRVRSPLP